MVKQIPVGDTFALVDDEDYERVNQFKWRLKRDGNNLYAQRHIRLEDGTRSTQTMHVFLTGYRTDHIDRNGLNNQRSNLREANHFQNTGNRRKNKNGTSKYRGVSRYHGKNGVTNKWRAIIFTNGKSKSLGLHDTEEDAARAWNKAALEKWGEFASLNVIEGEE